MCARGRRFKEIGYERITLISICYAPGEYKDVSNSERSLLVKRNEREIAEFVSRCLTCQQIKAEHQKPTGLL